MSRAPLLRALVAFAALAASCFAALTIPARLGLDLRGGTQIVLQTRDTDTVKADGQATDRALEVLRRRVDALGVAEPTLARAGERRIIVELPGLQDPREAAEVIGRTAQLTFHPVLSEPAAAPASPAPPATGATTDEDGRPVTLGPVALTGDAVTGAQAAVDPQRGPGWFVTIDFRGGGEQWRTLTGRAACAPVGDPARRVAIVLDDKVISSPQVDPSVRCEAGIGGGTTQITGRFTAEQAKDLAVLIEGGALPVPVEIIEQRTVGPTLGAAAIEASWQAGVIGLALTGLFIVAVYRLLGLLATVALAGYGLISYATLVALGATLTLPGLAGFVLAIGLAIDANVLVFERAREEYAEQSRRQAYAERHEERFGATAARLRSADERPNLHRALTAGFSRAWSAILDSNVTTLLAAGLMFALAAGPVRGFGVTLSIGVVASMVSALVVTRVLAEWALRRKAVTDRPWVTGLAGRSRVRSWLAERGPDLMRRARTWLAVSAVLVAVATAGIAARGLNLGVEFTGGRLLEYSTSRPVSADAAREAVADAGFPRAVVQSSSGDGQASGNENVTVRTEPITNDQAFAIERALSAAGGEVTKQRDELIGPSLGEELRNKALVALALALAAQLAYLAIRFRWTFALAAVLAMLHDVLIVVGIFAWLGKPIDGIFLAATLTIIGLSVNDTVVVFDRIRELRRANPLEPLPAVVNRAALQTVPRTINTGLGAMFILAALAILAGDSLTDFAVALLLGLLIGTWSSVFTASPLALLFERRWPALAPARASSAGRDARAGGDRAAVGARPAREVDPVDPYAFVDEAARDGGPAGGGWNRNG